MCGIVGYVGPRDCTDVLVSALTKLEYRGYDSAGIAVFENGNIAVDFLYDSGGAFLGGLALVRRGDERIYVDAVGHEVFSWHAE